MQNPISDHFLIYFDLSGIRGLRRARCVRNLSFRGHNFSKPFLPCDQVSHGLHMTLHFIRAHGPTGSISPLELVRLILLQPKVECKSYEAHSASKSPGSRSWTPPSGPTSEPPPLNFAHLGCKHALSPLSVEPKSHSGIFSG